MGYDITRITLETDDPGGPTYFRRNIFGMEPLRQVLEELGMGYWVDTPRFPGPDATEEELERYLRSTFSETPGIALHKFCSNDGWVVTPAECKSALAIWEKAHQQGQEVPEEFYDDFLPFLAACAASGGMEVW